MDLNSILAFGRELIERYGALGAFVLSFIGNAIPYATIPYLFVIAAVGSSLRLSTNEMILWSITGGLGAALGKVVVYLTGMAVSKVVSKEMEENLKIFARIARRSLFLAIFLFAALPLPDDVLYIPLGMAKYSLLRFFIAVFLGKTIITFMSLMFGTTYGEIAENYNVNPILSIIVFGTVTILISIVIARMDWIRIAIAYSEGGILQGTKALIEELAKALTFRKKHSTSS